MSSVCGRENLAAAGHDGPQRLRQWTAAKNTPSLAGTGRAAKPLGGQCKCPARRKPQRMGPPFRRQPPQLCSRSCRDRHPHRRRHRRVDGIFRGAEKREKRREKREKRLMRSKALPVPTMSRRECRCQLFGRDTLFSFRSSLFTLLQSPPTLVYNNVSYNIHKRGDAHAR